MDFFNTIHTHMHMCTHTYATHTSPTHTVPTHPNATHAKRTPQIQTQPQGVWHAALFNPGALWDVGFGIVIHKITHCPANCNDHGHCSEDGECQCQVGGVWCVGGGGGRWGGGMGVYMSCGEKQGLCVCMYRCACTDVLVPLLVESIETA